MPRITTTIRMTAAEGGRSKPKAKNRVYMAAASIIHISKDRMARDTMGLGCEIILKPSISFSTRISNLCFHLSGNLLGKYERMVRVAFFLRKRKIMIAREIRTTNKKIKAPFISQGGRGIKKTTIKNIKRTLNPSKMRSTKMVPRAEDMLIPDLVLIRYGLASSPILAGMATTAMKPTLVTEKREKGSISLIGLRMTPHLYALSTCIRNRRKATRNIQHFSVFLSPPAIPSRSTPLKERYTKSRPIAIPRNSFFVIL